MNNPDQKRQGFPPDEFAEALSDVIRADGFHGPVLGMSGSQYEKWIEPFLKKAKPCLRDLYVKHGVPPGDVIETIMLCVFSPVPATFPKILRSARPRERLARQFENLARITRDLDGLSTPVWGIKLFDDHLDLKLEDAAERIRKLRSANGRPKNRGLRECARYLLGDLQHHAKSKPRSWNDDIGTLLHAAFPNDFANLADAARAVSELLR